MTLREQVHERIDQLDDAALSKLIKQLDALMDSESLDFSPEFLDMLHSVHERNKDLSGEEALNIATEALDAERQSRR